MNKISTYDISVRHRGIIEQTIVTKVVDVALAQGYECRVDDGEEVHPWSVDRATLLDALMNTDDDTLRKEAVNLQANRRLNENT